MATYFLVKSWPRWGGGLARMGKASHTFDVL
jgi:hypothetical protein